MARQEFWDSIHNRIEKMSEQELVKHLKQSYDIYDEIIGGLSVGVYSTERESFIIDEISPTFRTEFKKSVCKSYKLDIDNFIFIVRDLTYIDPKREDCKELHSFNNVNTKAA